MPKLVISLGIGIVAGIIDVIPMFVQKLDKYSIISAFIHWIVLGFVISYIQIPVASWLKGILIAEMAALPIAVLVLKSDPQSVIPILLMSAVLGALVGLLTAKFAA
ncbi:MAG TPA: hypothetical protein DCZ95_11005 [Verrucomicrobia bacterium]|nr:MAG: hypothetical protein A2X46_07980 [Lentisphaerae bacterium GWF2_57_35]HBA84613.1 hypothetical protein [Verrucomicrobiota bacterium]